MKSTHSEKALKTITEMGTLPADWGLTEIEWRKERRAVPTLVDCPECRGRGEARYRPDGKLVTQEFMHQTVGSSYAAWLRYWEENHVTEEKCKRCPARRGHAGTRYGTGRIWKMVTRVIYVGYVQWADGTLFDSRFGPESESYYGRMSESVCQLCSKSINKSGRVPVTGRGRDGRIHGMWVGLDCAQKFFGVRNFKKDQFINDNLN